MPTSKVSRERIVQALPELHRSLIEIVGEMNRPERDAAILARAGLTLERALFPLLVLIGKLGPVGVVDLAGRVGRDYTTVSRQVARLEKLGLISRHPGREDRRTCEAVITAQGKTATDSIDRAREEIVEERFKDWNRADFDDLCRLLRRYADGLSKASRPDE